MYHLFFVHKRSNKIQLLVTYLLLLLVTSYNFSIHKKTYEGKIDEYIYLVILFYCVRTSIALRDQL